jgi:hypothetical protein
MPTMSTSFLCSLAADFALAQWTRHSLGLGQPVVDTVLQYCGYTHRLVQANLAVNGRCRGGHVVLERARLPKPLAECTFTELGQFAGLAAKTLAQSSLTLGQLSYVESAVCGCGPHEVRSFVPGGATLGSCATCAQPISPQPYYSSRPTPGSDLNSQRDWPLKKLGGAVAAWAVVQVGDRGVLLREKNHDL